MGLDLKNILIHLTFAFLLAIILFAISHGITHIGLLSIVVAVIIGISFFYGKPFIQRYGQKYKQEFYFILIVSVVLTLTSFIGNTYGIITEFAVITFFYILFFIIVMNIKD
jgi:hypothetical protein